MSSSSWLGAGPANHRDTWFFASKWPFYVLLFAIAAITGWRLGYLSFEPFSLYADEAQYWLWSKNPDWGYYSKPPVVAWAIALTTSLFGSDSPFFVKMASPLAYALTTLIVYWLGEALFNRRTGFWAALLFLTLPGVSVSALIISTDPFLLLFWALAMLAVWHAMHEDTESPWRWWLVAGLAAGLGMLSKYNFVFFAVSVFLFSFWQGNGMAAFRRGGLWGAVLLAAVLFAPNIIWNAVHGWVSIGHTSDISRIGEAGTSYFNPKELGEFVGAQFGLMGPILFTLLLAAIWQSARRWEEQKMSVRFLLAMIIPLFATILVLSLLTRAHGNWAAPIYVPATILVTHWLVQKGWRVLIGITLLLHISLAAIGANAERIVTAFDIPMSKRVDPFYRVRGWELLGEQVKVLRAMYPQAGLLTDRRKFSASLMYHARPDAYDLVQWNYDGAIRDHFLQSTTMDGKEGQDFLFIVPQPAPMDILSYFESYEALSPIVVPIYTGLTHRYDVFLAKNYQGRKAEEASVASH